MHVSSYAVSILFRLRRTSQNRIEATLDRFATRSYITLVRKYQLAVIGIKFLSTILTGVIRNPYSIRSAAHFVGSHTIKCRIFWICRIGRFATMRASNFFNCHIWLLCQIIIYLIVYIGTITVCALLREIQSLSTRRIDSFRIHARRERRDSLLDTDSNPPFLKD